MSTIYSNSVTDRLLACLIQDSTLCLNDKYKLDKSEFAINKFHQILYISIYNLACNGYHTISIMDLNEFLKSYESQYSVYLDNNGDSYIETIVELTDLENFEGYYKEFRKLACLTVYKQNGFDVTKFWNEEITDEKNLENLNQYTIEDIINYFEGLQVDIRRSFYPNLVKEEYQAGSDFMETKERFKEEPLVGNSFQSEYLNGIFRGMYGFLLRVAKSGGGKAQPVDTIIPTPNGYQRLGDIKVGDYVYDRKGNPTKVLGVFPQGKLDCYTVTLGDGRTTKCNDQHLWSYYDVYTDGEPIRTKTLREIMDLSNPVYIPTNEAIEYDKKEYDIDPYVMGSFLGDGCCLQKQLCFSSNDEEQVKYIANLLNTTYIKNSGKNYTWTFRNPNYENEKPYKNIQTKNIFKNYINELCTYSHLKRIPNNYKYGSIEQRMSLIQGLMDTDGSICVDDNRYNMIYFTTSYQLACDFMEVVRSLGYLCSIREDKRQNKRTGYKISILVDNSEKYKFFKLSRKLQRAIDAQQFTKRRKYNRIGIRKIEKDIEQQEMVCIYVDNEEHLYLTNDFIVTHNTITSMGDLCKTTVTEYYDFTVGDFVKNKSRKGAGLFINTELDLRKELDPIIIAWISGVSRSHIIKGRYDDGEEERVDRASEILNKSELYIIDDPQFTTKSLVTTIKDYVLNKNVKTVCFDYVMNNGFVAKEISSETKVPQREDMVLLTLTDRLKQVQRECDVSLISSVQTNGQEDNMEYPTEAVLAGGKSQVRKTDGTMCMLSPSKKELNQLENAIAQWNKKHNKIAFGQQIRPNNVIHIIKGRGSKYPKNIKVFQYMDLGTGRTTDLFCTDKFNNLIQVDRLTIEYED